MTTRRKGRSRVTRRNEQAYDRSRKLALALRRGGTDAKNALLRLRRQEPLRVILGALGQVEDRADVRRLLVGRPFVGSVSELGDPIRVKRTTPERELLWHCAALLRHREQLSAFLADKVAFERAMLLGQLDRALEIHREATERIGQSLWAIETGLLLSEASGGLEENRRYLADIRGSSKDKFIQLFSHFWSHRAESSVSFASYSLSVHEFLAKTLEGGSDAEAADYLCYRLDPWQLKTRGGYRNSLGYILWADNRFPLIDRYLTTVQLLQMDAAAPDTARGQLRLTDDVYERLESLGDIRLRHLRLFSSESFPPVDTGEAPLAEAIEAYTVGDYEKCALLAREGLVNRPDCLEYYELLARSVLTTAQTLASPFRAESPAEALLGSIHSVLAKGTTAAPATGSLIKFALAYDSFRLGQQVFCFAVRNLVPLGGINFDAMEALNASILSPRFTNAFSDPARAGRLLNHGGLAARFPTTTALFRTAALGNKPTADTSRLKSIPATRIAKYRAIALEREDKYREAAEQYREMLDAANGAALVEQDAISGLFRCLLQLGELDECMRLMLRTYFRRPQLLAPIPLNELLRAFDGAPNRRQLGTDLGWALIHYIHYQETGEKTQTYTLYSLVADFLAAVGVERPSELVRLADQFASEQLALFWRRVCVPDVLDYFVLTFNGTDELESERAAICEAASLLDPSGGASDRTEIEQLKQNRLLRESIQHVEESKVFVDIEGIERSLDDAYRDKFERYLKISAIGDQRIRAALVLQGYDISDSHRIVNFDDYGFILFKDLFLSLRDRFVSSNDYGLDSYLSLRIRHGTLLAHLRSPFEKFHLITIRDKEGRYGRNEYWAEKLAYIGDNDAAAVDHLLREMSAEIDIMAEKVRGKWIQLRSKATHSEGLFDFEYSEEQLKVVYAKHSGVSDFNTFFRVAIQELWQRTEENLAVVKHAITRTLRDDMLAVIDSTQQHLSSIAVGQLGELVTALTQCRTQVQQDLERLAAWFTVLDQKIVSDFTLAHLVRTCQAILRRCFPLRPLEVDTQCTPSLRICGTSFTRFVDILNILLENVLTHSGLERPLADVSGELANGMLTLRVRNALGPEANIDQCRAVASRREREPADLTSDGRARTEGGTGLYKLQKLLRHDLRRESWQLDISVGDGPSFDVRIDINADGILHADTADRG